MFPPSEEEEEILTGYCMEGIQSLVEINSRGLYQKLLKVANLLPAANLCTDRA